MTDQLLITVPEAAQRLGIGRTRAWEMTQRGEMPGVVRIGRSVRVSVAALRAWIDAQTREQRAA